MTQVKSIEQVQNERECKWSQWGKEGMLRCGIKDYKTIIGWIRELGHDAKKCLMAQEKNHAIYAMVMHDDTGMITEIRLYFDAYLTDEELDVVAVANPGNTLYVVHK